MTSSPSRSRSRSRSRPRSRSRSRSEQNSDKRGRSRSGSRHSSSASGRSSPDLKKRSKRKRDSSDSDHKTLPAGSSSSTKRAYHSSDSSDEDDRDRAEKRESRAKKLRRINIANPFSVFENQTRQRKVYTIPTDFVKEQWFKIRGMNERGKFKPEDDSKPDAWKEVAKSERILKRYSAEIFSESKLDDGLSSIVVKKESSEDKDLIKNQKIFGATAHLSLKAMEESGNFYNKISNFVIMLIGEPTDPNPSYEGEGSKQSEFIYSENQQNSYDEFCKILADYQVDVTEPISNITRLAASSYTTVLSRRREKVLKRIESTNPQASTSIKRIPPSASTMFGGDHGKLEKVVKLAKDLQSTKKSNRGDYSSNKSSYKNYDYKFSGKKNYNSKKSFYNSNKNDKKKSSFRGGNASRGEKKRN